MKGNPSRKRKLGEDDTTKVSEQPKSDEIVIAVGSEKTPFTVSQDTLTRSSRVFRTLLQCEWKESATKEIHLEDIDLGGLAKILDILRWHYPEITSGHEAGSLVIVGERYEWTPILAYVRNYLQHRFVGDLLNNRSDYLGILIAASEVDGKDLFAKVTGYVVYTLSPREFLDGLQDDHPESLWLTYGDVAKKELFEQLWHSLWIRVTQLLGGIYKAAIDLMCIANLDIGQTRSLSRALEALMNRDPLQLSICELMNKLSDQKVARTDARLVIIRNKLTTGEAGLCLDCVKSQPLNLQKDATQALIGKSRPIGMLKPYQHLNAQKFRNEGTAYKAISVNGGRDYCRETLKKAGGWVANAAGFIGDVEQQLKDITEAQSLFFKSCDTLYDWASRLEDAERPASDDGPDDSENDDDASKSETGEPKPRVGSGTSP